MSQVFRKGPIDFTKNVVPEFCDCSECGSKILFKEGEISFRKEKFWKIFYNEIWYAHCPVCEKETKVLKEKRVDYL